MYIRLTELRERYDAGERNFAGMKCWDDSDVLRGSNLSNIILIGAYLPISNCREQTYKVLSY